MRIPFVLLSVVSAACLQADVTRCANGDVCASSLACDDKHSLCVHPEQLVVCGAAAEQSACSFGDGESGLCTDGVCLPTFCGDGVISGNEECELGNEPIACTALGFYNPGPLAECAASCVWNRNDCTGKCDDGTLDPAHEYCDGSELPDTNDSCLTFGYDGGALGCSQFCAPAFDDCIAMRWQLAAKADDILAIWGSAQSAAMAVGENGLAMWWNGIEWRQLAPPTSLDLVAIAGTSADDIYVVGTDLDEPSRGEILHWNGSTWTTMAIPRNDVDLHAIWIGDGTGYAAGDDATMLRLAGGTWQPMMPPDAFRIRAVWGRPNGAVYAGSLEGLHHFDGQRWERESLAGSERVRALWGLPSGELYAVGDEGLAVWFDGTVWRELMTTICPGSFLDVWASAPDDVYAVGALGNFSTTIFHFNGTGWVPLDTPNRVKVSTVWGSASDDVWLGNQDGVFHGRGLYRSARIHAPQVFCNDPPPRTCEWTAANVIAGSSEATVFAFANSIPDVCHFNGQNWRTVATLNERVFAAWVSPSGEYYAVVTSETTSTSCNNQPRPTYRANAYTGNASTAPRMIPIDSFATVADVTGISDSAVFAVGTRASDGCATPTAAVWQWNGSAWDDLVAPVGATSLRSVWARSASEVYVADSGTKVYRYDGTTWTPLPDLPRPCADVQDLVGFEDVLVLGCRGAPGLYRFDGSAWTETGSPIEDVGTRLVIGGTSPDDVFVFFGDISDAAQIRHYRSTNPGARANPVRFDGRSILDALVTPGRIFWVTHDGVHSLVRAARL